MSEQATNFDIVIIGAGPAGLTSAIYASWLGHKTLVLDSQAVGGRAANAPVLKNFPGFEEGIKGSVLVEKMKAQAERFGAQIKSGEGVVGLERFNENHLMVVSKTDVYEASAVIIATGTQRRKLHVEGEEAFLGRGVSYCPVCDGPFFKNKTVAVVGNGEEALLDALHLSDLASRVVLVSEEKEFKIKGDVNERLAGKGNVVVVYGQVTAIVGDKVVDAIKLRGFGDQNEAMESVAGVFIALGGVPLTQIVRNVGVETDKSGCLLVDRFQKTNVEGVYAAGDCTCGGMQVVTAAGEGAMAAMKASAYIRKAKVKIV